MDRYKIIWKIVQKYGYKYDLSKISNQNMNSYAEIGIPNIGFKRVNLKSLLQKNRKFAVPEESENSQRMTWEGFIKITNDKFKLDNDEPQFTYKCTNWIGYKTKDIEIFCKKCAHTTHQSVPSHLHSKGCKECSNREKSDNMKMSQEEYIDRCKKIYGDKYILDKIIYKGATEYVTPICPIHGEFKIYAINFLKGNGCTECLREEINNRQRKTHEQFVEESDKIHGKGRYIYLTKYQGRAKPITFKCTKCGNETTKLAVRHLKGVGCSFCSSSRLEREIGLLLDNENINYIKEYNINNQFIDFYLPKQNIAIECQGKQHFDMKFYFKSKEIKGHSLEDLINRDIKKYNYCKENNIKLLYFVKYEHFQPEYLNNKIFGNIYSENNVFTNTEELLEEIKGE